jgi:hypothetical protein
MPSGPHIIATARRIEARQVEQFGHPPDMPGPQRRALARRHQHLGVRQLRPAVVLLAPDQVLGVLHALDDDQLAEALAPPQHVMDHRHHRRAAEPAGHQHDVAPAHFLQRPAAPERSAQPHPIAGLQRGQAAGDAPLTARMVWPMPSRSSGSDMMEIGTSPTP